MEEIIVNLGKRSYPILIGNGLVNEAGGILKERGVNGKLLVVTNPTIAKWYLSPLLNSLRGAGFTVEAVEIPDGEIYKNLEQANQIYDALVAGRYDRKSILIALGGGVIGDLTGFVATTYMRGTGFIQIPTTLLAQVDSSIGGKVAVNHPRGKNLIGAFYQPGLVITDVGTLKTLPKAEFNSGMAEVIKHGIILDENYFRFITGELESIREADPRLMAWVVAGSCRIKARIVEEDEQETGLRAVLNFGHTIGHALESVTNYTYYKHGEAVALGMLAAVNLAAKAGVLKDPDLAGSLKKLVQELELPERVTGLRAATIYEALYLDKKVDCGSIRWVLPEVLGKVKIVSDLPEQMVLESIREIGGN
ncbi:MAG: 3-dehydroquinate synthase [Firmicutes bacterium]|nr:3-dehydroquinate synthase [Bacillota bacterium]